MNLIKHLAEHYDTLSIVGMSKNAGKTTALNYLIEEADNEGICIGVTSTGRDGESKDLVTGTEKPRIYLYEDTLVSIPHMLFNMAEASLEILWKSHYRTPLGELLICRVREEGYVQIAGAMTTSDTKAICEEMKKEDCSLVLIDGAIDRKSIASPETSDAIILATGAVLSRSLQKVVEETAHIVQLYGLHEASDPEIVQLSHEAIQADKVAVIKTEGNHRSLKLLDISTGLGNSIVIDEAIDESTTHVFVPGAFTTSVIADINIRKLKQVEFILKDPTKIFLDSVTYRQLCKKGFKVKVIKNINVAAVTVNPYSPSGYSFDHKALQNAMQEALPHIPVIDVRL